VAEKKARWRRYALQIAIVVAVFVAYGAWMERGTAQGRAPALTGTMLSGESVPRLRGQPTLVHFWATWCGVCRAEQGTIDDLAEGHRVVSVASQSGDAPRVGAYMHAERLDFPVVIDRDGALAYRWGVHAFPTTFVIGSDGEIDDVEVGYTTSIGLRWRLFWTGVF
jgi:thiol-disulfide isomerase/thioredoxin